MILQINWGIYFSDGESESERECERDGEERNSQTIVRIVELEMCECRN